MSATKKPSVWRTRLLTVVGSITLLVVVGLVIAGIAWLKMQQMNAAMSAPPPPEMPVAVKLFQPQPTQFRQHTVVVGSVLANRSVTLRNEETGMVTKVSMTPGGRVKAGDTLVQMDDRVERAELKAAQATVKQADASLKRARRLKDAKANSDEEFDVAMAAAERAAAEVDRLSALVDRKRITVEFDAKVGLFDLHPGQYLVAGSDLVRLEGIADYLLVDFAVPAHVADQIDVGVTVKLKASENSPLLSATIIALDSRADPQTRSLTARAKLPSPPKTLLPGDSVLVTVEYGPEISAVLIPQTAVRRGPAGTSVFLAVEKTTEDGSPPTLRATSNPVELAGSDGTMSRIIRGVSLKDRVVTDGSFKVFESSLLGPVESASETPSKTQLESPPLNSAETANSEETANVEEPTPAEETAESAQ